jgi:hypothetical protein
MIDATAYRQPASSDAFGVSPATQAAFRIFSANFALPNTTAHY